MFEFFNFHLCMVAFLTICGIFAFIVFVLAANKKESRQWEAGLQKIENLYGYNKDSVTHFLLLNRYDPEEFLNSQKIRNLYTYYQEYELTRGTYD